MKTEALDQFRKSTGELISILEDFSPSDLNEIPFYASWTAGQVGDHLYRSYAVIKTLYGNVVSASRPVDEKIDGIRELFLDFNIKMSSPEAILPSMISIDKITLLDGLKERIEKLDKFIREEDLFLVCTDYAIPEYGPFTGLEWVYFTIYHTQRHLHQIKRIKDIISAKDYSGKNLSH